MLLLVAVAILLVVWYLLVHGFVYLAVRASILEKPRHALVRRNPPFFGELLSCDWCSSLYAGIFSYCLLHPFTWAILELSATTVLLSVLGLLLSGPGAIGVIEATHKQSPLSAVKVFTRKLDPLLDALTSSESKNEP